MGVQVSQRQAAGGCLRERNTAPHGDVRLWRPRTTRGAGVVGLGVALSGLTTGMAQGGDPCARCWRGAPLGRELREPS